MNSVCNTTADRSSWHSTPVVETVLKFRDIGRPGLRGDRFKHCFEVNTAVRVLMDAVNQDLDPGGLRRAVRRARHDTPLALSLCDKISRAVLYLPPGPCALDPLFVFALYRARVYRISDVGILRLRQFLWTSLVGYGPPGALLPEPPSGIIADLSVVPADVVAATGSDEEQTSGPVRHEPGWSR